jgi:hypothetical protein
MNLFKKSHREEVLNDDFPESNGNEAFVEVLRLLRQIREATKLKFLQKIKAVSYKAFKHLTKKNELLVAIIYASVS